MYFGWLCNDIIGYEFNNSIPTSVFTRTGNQRPYIVPHKDFDHPFVKDYYNGITLKEAEKRIKTTLLKEIKKTALKNLGGKFGDCYILKNFFIINYDVYKNFIVFFINDYIKSFFWSDSICNRYTCAWLKTKESTVGWVSLSGNFSDKTDFNAYLFINFKKEKLNRYKINKHEKSNRYWRYFF